MRLTQKELEYWLASIDPIGPVKTARLLERFETEERIYEATREELEQVGLTKREQEGILASRNVDLIRQGYENVQNKGIALVSVHDRQYPQKLRYLDNAPYALFVRGRLPKVDCVSIAIVGARNSTAYGKEVARWFGKELSNAGVQVISGMAYGVDGMAHRGALEGRTPTYAVLGCGVDVCYPKENFQLYMHMVEHCGVLSEYGPGIPGRAYQFPMRNRIISGLCDGVLVVEARAKSGSLITADLALEQGKNIFAVPGRIQDPLSEGCINLIRQGAEPVSSPKDILEHFQIRGLTEQKQLQPALELDLPQKRIYSALSLEPKHIEVILKETGLLLTELISYLLKMELDGFVRQTAPNYYVRCIL